MLEDDQVSTQFLIYNTNIITFFLNGKIRISEEIMLAILPGNEHCLKIGTDIISLKKMNDVIHLINDEFEIPFSVEKKDGRYFLKNLQKEGFGLLRYISTSQKPTIITPDPGLHVLAQNMYCHQDIIFLFKTDVVCKFQYCISEIISDNKKSIEVKEKTYEDIIRLSSQGFTLERKVG